MITVYVLLKFLFMFYSLFLSNVAVSRPRWRLGNKELSQLWKWADQNPVRCINVKL